MTNSGEKEDSKGQGGLEVVVSYHHYVNSIHLMDACNVEVGRDEGEIFQFNSVELNNI